MGKFWQPGDDDEIKEEKEAKKVSNKMRQEQTNNYCSNLGLTCPECEGGDLRTGPWDGEGMTVEVECQTCGFEWKELYRLVGIMIGDTEYYAKKKRKPYGSNQNTKSL
jgi:Zn ribbon nucleic-acid-binding protein